MPDAVHRSRPNVVIITNEGPGWSEFDLKNSARMQGLMQTGLTQEGYVCRVETFYDDLSFLDRYDRRTWVVWNWGEELGGVPFTDWKVAAELEQRGFVYTGSPPQVLLSSMDRAAVKERLRQAGLPTLPYHVFRGGEVAEIQAWGHYPAIVKGLHQHASTGVTRESIVHTPEELAARVGYMRETYQDESIVEPFLDTREFHVGVWGNGQIEVLPPTELVYTAFADMHDRLYTYHWKFDPASRGYSEIRMPCPEPQDRPDWMARLVELAAAAYRLMGIRDYGRFDFRMWGDEPQLLDVNPNPDIDVTSVIPIATKYMGLSYGQMAGRIVQYAAQRLPA